MGNLLSISGEGAPESLIIKRVSPWNRDTRLLFLFWRFCNKQSVRETQTQAFISNFQTNTHSQREMEDEGIGLVLARATELRLKINNCIHKATTTTSINGLPQQQTVDKYDEEDQEQDQEEMERLLNICDAFESLESQLSSLQVLASKPHFLY